MNELNSNINYIPNHINKEQYEKLIKFEPKKMKYKRMYIKFLYIIKFNKS